MSNRHQRRALERQIRKSVGTITAPRPESVVLRGGPMDGWVVKPDAPALRRDWHTTLPRHLAQAGYYGDPILIESLRVSTWIATDEALVGV